MRVKARLFSGSCSPSSSRRSPDEHDGPAGGQHTAAAGGRSRIRKTTAEHSTLIVVGVLLLGSVLSFHHSRPLLLSVASISGHSNIQGKSRRILMEVAASEPMGLVGPVRRQLILDQVFGGNGPRYISANDAIFNVLRSNKRDVELVGGGDPDVVDLLRSRTEALTSWVAPTLGTPQEYQWVQAVVTFAFGPIACANQGIAWLVENQYVGTVSGGVVGPSTPVIAHEDVALALTFPANTTSVTSITAEPNADMQDIAPLMAAAIPSPHGAVILVVSHPDQAVRAVKLMEMQGYSAYAPDYSSTPWSTFGCDGNGYANANANAIGSGPPQFQSRQSYIAYEINQRENQAYAGQIAF